MQIKEVQEKLKISSYTLRYYEKMGLIQPYRDENGYRNYNEEDIHKIERIMFLRDINVPIEDIKDILDNKVTFQDVLESHIQKVNTEIESLQYIKNMCEDLKEKNIPLLDQVIEGNQIGNEKVKKKDLKKVFDYFKKDQTVVIGYKSIPRSLLGISVLSLFISGIFGILIGLAFPNMISYVNEQTRSSVQHFQIPFYKASGKLIIFSMCISFIILLIIFVICETKLEYVELTDNKISICSYHYQSRKSILKSLITKKENNENKEYAVQFLRFLADENRMKSYIDEFGFLAPRQEIMQQQFKNDEEKGAFIDLYQNARIREISSNWPQISLTLSDTLREILVNEEDSQTILDKGAEKIESIGAENR